MKKIEEERKKSIVGKRLAMERFMNEAKMKRDKELMLKKEMQAI